MFSWLVTLENVKIPWVISCPLEMKLLPLVNTSQSTVNVLSWHLIWLPTPQYLALGWRFFSPHRSVFLIHLTSDDIKIKLNCFFLDSHHGMEEKEVRRTLRVLEDRKDKWSTLKAGELWSLSGPAYIEMKKQRNRDVKGHRQTSLAQNSTKQPLYSSTAIWKLCEGSLKLFLSKLINNLPYLPIPFWGELHKWEACRYIVLLLL